jgi:hypothetical protein
LPIVMIRRQVVSVNKIMNSADSFGSNSQQHRALQSDAQSLGLSR